jgi:hypothetical protein
MVYSGEWEFPDGSVSVSFWHFDSVVNPAFFPPKMRHEMETAIHKARVSAVAAGCQEFFEVQPDEVLEWRRLRELSVTEARRKCAVELALATKKVHMWHLFHDLLAALILLSCSLQYLQGDVGFSSFSCLGTPFHEKKSLDDLKRVDRDDTDLDVNNLEKYLIDDEFEDAFGISSFAFRLLKPQDQKALVSILAHFSKTLTFVFVTLARILMNIPFQVFKF